MINFTVTLGGPGCRLIGPVTPPLTKASEPTVGWGRGVAGALGAPRRGRDAAAALLALVQLLRKVRGAPRSGMRLIMLELV